MSGIAVESTSRCSSSTSGNSDRDLLDDRAPQPARGEHVGLVHAREALAPAARQLEGEARHAAHLGLGVEERVVRLAAVGAVVGLAPLAEVEAAGELADDEHVHALDEVAAGAATRRRARLRGHGAQVGEEARAPCGARSRACSGRTVAVGSSHFGPPTAPSSTASAAAQSVEVLVADGRCRRRRWRRRRRARPTTRRGSRSARAAASRTALGRGHDLRADAVAGDGDDAVGRRPRQVTLRLRGGRDGRAGCGLVPEQLLERREVGLERRLDDVRR